MDVDVAATVSGLPANAVDWVIVQLRTGTGPKTTIATALAILLENGSVVGLDGAPLILEAVSAGSYHVVLRHRNHLAVISTDPVDFSTGTGAIDFTTSSLSALGVNPMSVLADGRYGLISGEASTSGTIQTGDFVLWSKNNAAVAASGVPEE